MQYIPEFGCWNEGTGNANQRTLSLILNALEAKSPITRWISREILADKINRALGHSAGE
jgi:hypothetical protein